MPPTLECHVTISNTAHSSVVFLLLLNGGCQLLNPLKNWGYLMAKDVYVAFNIVNMSDIGSINGFEPYPFYSNEEYKNLQHDEFGRLSSKDINFRFFGFSKNNILDLRSVLYGSKSDKEKYIELKSFPGKSVLVKDFHKHSFSQVVNLLVEWVLNQPDNTFPPNFNIFTDTTPRGYVVQISYNPMKKRNVIDAED